MAQGLRRCPDDLRAVFADMHDGDKKQVSISGNSISIRPFGNNETWVVNAAFDSKSCSASVDFNVPGKPGPPPVNITLTLWYAVAAFEKEEKQKATFEFTDPSGTLAAPGVPLNKWIELDQGRLVRHLAPTCPQNLQAVFADMHDGDKKEVTISGSSMAIKPSGNSQSWRVNAVLDEELCRASVNFNVPGKLGPPPVNVTLTLWSLFSSAGRKTSFEFTDPSGTLALPDFPLNHWVQLEEPQYRTITS